MRRGWGRPVDRYSSSAAPNNEIEGNILKVDLRMLAPDDAFENEENDSHPGEGRGSYDTEFSLDSEHRYEKTGNTELASGQTADRTD